MAGYYVLHGHKPVSSELAIWARSMESRGDERIVAKSSLKKNVSVSTVFVGLEHQWGEGPPLLFETMIFGGEHDGYQERYSTWEEAEEGHAEAVKLVKE